MGAILLFAGLAAVAVGALISFAGMMSDAPQLGDDYGKRGCIVIVGGVLAIVVGTLLLFHVIG